MMKKMNVRSYVLVPVLMLLIGVALGVIAGSKSTPVFEAAEPAIAAQEPRTLEAARSFSDAIIDVSEKVTPTVVTIFSEKTVKNPLSGLEDSPLRDFFGDEFSRRFFGHPGFDREYKQRGLGSGVIVTEDGYILTNNHVVAGADRISVGIGGDDQVDGEIVGTDRATDLAVIKIDKKELKPANLGDSEGIKVGEWVVAIGNPFGLEHTVTAGIISYKGRSNVRIADYEDFIQTDAAINPGNSGGPLVDLDGKVIGINTAIASNTGAYQGVGFAIPINLARRIMDELIESGKVVRGWLGVYIQDITDAMAEALDLPTKEGVLVADVVKEGPSSEAGLQRGDVILELNGEELKDGAELRNKVAAMSPGTKVKLLVLREGKKKDMSVTLGELPVEEEVAVRGGGRDVTEELGLAMHDLSPEIARRFGLDASSGVIITEVLPGSPAQEAGLNSGDIIIEVNQRDVESVGEVTSILSALEPGDSVLFLIERERATLFIAMKMPEK
jgi:serine protease Do